MGKIDTDKKDWQLDLIGKVFKKGGGKYPGYWIVVGLTPSRGCICMGVDKAGVLVSAANYQPYYVAGKREIAKVKVDEIRFAPSSTTYRDPALRRTEAPDLSAIFDRESAFDG